MGLKVCYIRADAHNHLMHRTSLLALPHPSLPTNTLHKHIKADDPPAIRFRTLVTWSMHRLRESMEQNSNSHSLALREAARQALAATIKDLAEKRVDLSWTPEHVARVRRIVRITS